MKSGSVVIQTFVCVREQVYSNLIGLHAVTGLPATAQPAGPFGSRATGIGEPAAQGTAMLASIVRREAYVLAYIDAFWLIAWVSLLGILLVLLLRPPPPNPLIPSRGAL
jgi:MFS transporter, DHA2 family, multidrug resistance protein